MALANISNSNIAIRNAAHWRSRSHELAPLRLALWGAICAPGAALAAGE